jgi:predicted nucleotidyltransferase
MQSFLMPTGSVNDPILKRFRAGLGELYRGRLKRVVLFGSSAHSDAREDSDYNVAVFLRAMSDRFAEKDRLADLRRDLLDETAELIQAMPYRAGSYDERTSLMREIRGEGVDL